MHGDADRLIPRRVAGPLSSALRGSAPNHRSRRVADVLGPPSMLERHLDWVTAGRRHQRVRSSTDRCFARTGCTNGRRASLLTDPRAQRDAASAGAYMALDQRHWLPDDVLAKADRATMLCSLEMRTPFLHRELAELAAAVPLDYHLKRRGKRVLRDVYDRLDLPSVGAPAQASRSACPSPSGCAARWRRCCASRCRPAACTSEGWFDRERHACIASRRTFAARADHGSGPLAAAGARHVARRAGRRLVTRVLLAHARLPPDARRHPAPAAPPRDARHARPRCGSSRCARTVRREFDAGGELDVDARAARALATREHRRAQRARRRSRRAAGARTCSWPGTSWARRPRYAVKRMLGVPSVVYLYAKEVGASPRLARLAVRTFDRIIVVSRYTAQLARDAGADGGALRRISPGVDAAGSGVSRDLRTGRRSSRSRGSRTATRATTSGPRAGAHPRARAGRPVGRHRATARCAGHRAAGARAWRLGPRPAPGRRLGRRARPLADAQQRLLHAEPAARRDRAGEGFGIVYLEAGAQGLPVVAGNVGGAVDAVVDGVTGMLVDPTDHVAVADAIADLLLDARAGGAHGRGGARCMRPSSRGRSIARRVESVFAELAA